MKATFADLLEAAREAAQSLQSEGGNEKVKQAASLVKTGLEAQEAVSANPLTSVQMLISAALELHETVEQEQTKRMQILKAREVALKQIEASRFLLNEYMTRTFDERRATLDCLFGALAQAQERNDAEALQQLLGSIVEVARVSPFKDLADFKKTYQDPNFTLEL